MQQQFLYSVLYTSSGQLSQSSSSLHSKKEAHFRGPWIPKFLMLEMLQACISTTGKHL